MIEDLYKKYGEAMIQLEILQSHIQNLKQRISAELNKNGKQIKIEKEQINAEKKEK